MAGCWKIKPGKGRVEHMLKDGKSNTANTCRHGTALMLKGDYRNWYSYKRVPVSVLLAWKADFMEVFQAPM